MINCLPSKDQYASAFSPPKVSCFKSFKCGSLEGGAGCALVLETMLAAGFGGGLAAVVGVPQPFATKPSAQTQAVTGAVDGSRLWARGVIFIPLLQRFTCDKKKSPNLAIRLLNFRSAAIPWAIAG